MPWEVTFDPSRPFAVKTLRISAVSLLRGIKVLVTRGGLNFLLMSRKKGPLCPNNENQRCIKRQVFDVFDTRDSKKLPKSVLSDHGSEMLRLLMVWGRK